MPQRVTTILTMALGVLGLGVLAALIVLRADVQRAAATGPPWKRRLVGAALLLLATIGGAAPGCRTPSSEGPAQGKTPATAPAVDPVAAAWERIDRAWDHAEALAGGSLGEKLFDAAGKKAALAEVDSVAREIPELVRVRAITEPEALLLRAELELTRQGLAAMPPEPVVSKTGGLGFEGSLGKRDLVIARLDSAGAALKGLAAQDRLNPRVVARVLPAIEGDLGVLSGWDGGSDPKAPDDNMEEVRLLAAAVRGKVCTSGENLAARPEWGRIAAIWGRAEYTCTGGTPAFPFSELGKLQMLRALYSGARDVEALRSVGLLSEPEKTFLTEELGSLVHGVRTMMTFAERGTWCYGAMPSYPLYPSPEQIAKRVSLLAELAAGGKVKPEVAVRAAYALDRDMPHYENDHHQLVSLEEGAKSDPFVGRAFAAEKALRSRLPAGGDLVNRAAQWKQIGHTLALPVKERKADDPDPDFFPMGAVCVPLRLLKASGDLRPNEFQFMEKAIESWDDRNSNPDPRRDLVEQVADLEACLAAGPVSADFAKAAQIVLRHYRDLADKAPEPEDKDIGLFGGPPEEERQAAAGARQASVKLEKQLQDVIDAAGGKDK